MIPTDQFGKDHWSLLAYIECRCVDNAGIIDRRQMRCNTYTHPKHVVQHRLWMDSWGTRLRGYFEAEGDVARGKLIVPSHDDWDCLEDLAAAGFCNILGEISVSMTDLGNQTAAQLRVHIQRGGVYANFTLS